MAKIGFCGTQSVGKSTLVKELSKLSEFKNYYFSTERSKYLRDLGIPLNTDSTIKGQTIFLAERVSELLRDNVVTDRTILDVMAFTECAKSINYGDKNKFITYASTLVKEYDYIFYISPEGIEMEDNLVRSTDINFRNEIDKSIRRLISKYKNDIKNLEVIHGSVEERIEQVKKIILL
jgi:hypothetical protein